MNAVVGRDQAAGSIDQARCRLYDLPVPKDRTDAVQRFTKQETVVVTLRTAAGVTGVGYAYTIGVGGTAIRALLDSHFLPLLVGADSSRPESIWTTLRNSTRATMVGPITALALAAIDTAVWDLRAKTVDLPLWRLAGGAQSRVPVYDTEGGWLHLSVDELVQNARAATERGLRGLKIKVGKPTGHEDLVRLRAVREAIGPEVALMVDANQGFTRDEALRRARLFEPLDLAWIEEPLPADDIQGHVQLARSTSTPVAVGESLYSLGQFRDYLTAGGASVVQPDVARIGGVTPWLKVAHLAESFNVPVAPHFLMEIHANLAAAVPNGRWVEWIPQLASVTCSTIEQSEGWMIPSEQPGIGIDWDSIALKRHEVTDA
jgi:L-alanine-DL-glutamate epimerase-like enolase superfamily enzyme